MAELITSIERTIDLTGGVTRDKLDEVFVRGDSAQDIEITVMQDGEPADLSGISAIIWFVRGDGVSRYVPCVIAGNVVTAQVTSDCTSVVGRMHILLQLTDSAYSTQTVMMLTTYVLAGSTDAIQDMSGTIPTIQELIDRIQDVNDAAEAAYTAADNAQDAADAITGITAEAGVVTDSNEATAFAEIDPVDDHINLVFGIPRARLTWSGTAITGTSATPTAYATGITYAMTGDRYRYNGTTDAQIGNEYVCTTPGDAATALWVYDGNIRGAAGSVTSVDGVAPDIAGDVALAAVKIADIINVLTSTVTNKPLSAAQGKVLKDLINTLTNALKSGAYKQVQTGSVSVSADAAGVTAQSITFGTAFTSTPIVMPFTLTSAPQSRLVGILSTSTTGATLQVYNALSAATITVYWAAINLT